MFVEHNKMEEKALPNFKGGEKEFNVRMFDDGACKIMQGRLQPGASIGLHTHEGNSEVIYILEGTGTVLDDGVYHPVAAGDCLYCPEGHRHSLINSSEADLRFFAVVAEHHL